MQAQHVPAWKKLGLKLKYAKETTQPASHVTNNNVQSATTSLSNGEPPSKKRRVEHGSNSSHIAAPIVSGTTNHASPRVNGTKAKENHSSPASGKQAHQLRKKVSFSSDTKILDGDKQLDFYSSTDETNPQPDESFTGVQGDQDGIELSATSVSKKAKKPKLSKKAKSIAQAPNSNDSLTYLETFYTSPSSWKFSKNREVKILKHCLDTNLIPTSHNLALAHYVYGLKSTGARSRLLSDVNEKTTGEASTSEGEDAQDEDPVLDQKFSQDLKATPSSSFSAGLRSDEAYQAYIKGQSRPKVLLTSLNMSATGGDKERTTASARKDATGGNATSSMPDARSNSQKQAPLKKKKNRTAVVEYSSSSDSSSSSSSSESESDSDSTSITGKDTRTGKTSKEKAKRTKVANGTSTTTVTKGARKEVTGKKKKQEEDDTTSSSASSSSSESIHEGSDSSESDASSSS